MASVYIADSIYGLSSSIAIVYPRFGNDQNSPLSWDSGFRCQVSGLNRGLVTGFWSLVTGHWWLDAVILDAGCWILDAGCSMLDAGKNGMGYRV